MHLFALLLSPNHRAGALLTRFLIVLVAVPAPIPATNPTPAVTAIAGVLSAIHMGPGTAGSAWESVLPLAVALGVGTDLSKAPSSRRAKYRLFKEIQMITPLRNQAGASDIVLVLLIAAAAFFWVMSSEKGESAANPVLHAGKALGVGKTSPESAGPVHRTAPLTFGTEQSTASREPNMAMQVALAAEAKQIAERQKEAEREAAEQRAWNEESQAQAETEIPPVPGQEGQEAEDKDASSDSRSSSGA